MVKAGQLKAAAREGRALPAAERSGHLRRPRWLGDPRAQQLRAKLDDLLSPPPTHRMPTLLSVGATHAGKTMLANRCVQGHPADDTPAGDAVSVPVWALQAPPWTRRRPRRECASRSALCSV
jgi:hypothetical protein